ncbi:MAG: hypothetical protein HYV29_00160 [Ignavibacteriales bacterium]|nr:hypothetical protein [Ignavibacteriales bacterium]
MTIGDLYETLQASYTHDNLQKITRKIIDLHRNDQTNALMIMMKAVGEQQQQKKEHGSKAFYKLMMTYHPDRLHFYRNEIDKLYAAHDLEELKRYAHIFTALELESTLIVLKKPQANTSAYSDLWESVREESEQVDDEEFGEEADEDLGDEFDGLALRNNFFTVFKRTVYGNRKIELPYYYLEDLDSLDLAGSEIDDLDGIKYCKHLITLELSSNRITDISELASLTMLQEAYLANNRIGYIDGLGFLNDLRAVDLSYNDIDDLTPLFRLDHLEYVNITGNPVRSKQIDTLQKKGIIIII